MNDLTIAILAGGRSTRLKDVISAGQKVIAEIAGKPFICYLLDLILPLGIKNVFLCTGYEAETVEKRLGSSYCGMALSYSREPEPLGTGGAVRLILEKSASRYILVLNGDSYLRCDLNIFIDWFMNRKLEAALLTTEIQNVSRFGNVLTDENERILLFEEKGSVSTRGCINAGIYIFHRSILEKIPLNKNCSLEKGLFPILVNEKKLFGHNISSPFIDIGVPESYKNAEMFIKIILKDE